MPHFAAIGFDHPPHSMALRDAVRAEHRRYVLDHDATILMAGAMRDGDHNQCGTIYIFEAPSADKVWRWLRDEPFYASGVHETMRVVEWTPTRNRFDPIDWPEQPSSAQDAP